MDKKTELKLKEAKGKLKLAKKNLKVAHSLLEDNNIRVCTDISYNVAELCARALILLKIDIIPSRHGGIVRKFGEFYVKDGPLDKEIGRKMNKGLEYRGDARYKYEANITKTHAVHNLNLAEKLIAFLEKELI
jgi:uncharacterized protein (UPF0332 family)